MSQMSNLCLAIEEDITDGLLSFREIATKHQVPLSWVEEVWTQLTDQYDESMDGDFDSAMASAGYGTDEDYGYYGD